ncbi:hypothetical protein AGR4A_Lc60059 [Agrobacterium tumefaciens str. B6]|uniref:Uncharacterized protein n=1 Tax=Agrobacterium tumefaciens str. B6 TaxID=1183423 RepID=A0A822VBT3_AGRTU|nr:hypothetical protein AGR4A_Lc60059 [Agrobacterium tumefaciens str. B6]
MRLTPPHFMAAMPLYADGGHQITQV